MNNLELIEKLKQLDACQSAVEWVGARDFVAAWNECDNRSWMFWLLGQIKFDRKKLVLIACECARLSLKYVKEGELRPLAAIQMAERWANNDPTVTIEMVQEARQNAYAAADAYAAAGAYAAYAAAAAAAAAAADDDDDAYAAAYAAAAAADDAYAAAYAAAAAADDAYAAGAYAAGAYAVEINKKCLEIIRKYAPADELIELMEKLH